MNSSRHRTYRLAGGALCLVALLCAGFYLKRRFLGALPIQPGVAIDAPHPLATWPWPKARRSTPHRGVTHWSARAEDGTNVELLDFDFAANPGLRFEIFDQDEDDDHPFDNHVRYWPRGVGQMTRQLNAAGPGKVMAAWNGLFFGYYEGRGGPGHSAFHVSPVVLRGKVYQNSANHRWAFGVKYTGGKPVFKVFHLPGRATLEREFDFAAGSAQCLLKDGQPLRLQPFPQAGEAPMKQPVASIPQEAGHIPIFDHMKTSRASVGWTKDNRHLFVLLVKEPDSEAGSAIALKFRQPVAGGWTVPDVQRFWLAMKQEKGVWNAINSDAGDVLQATMLRTDGQYDLVPPGWATHTYQSRTFSPDFTNAPQGGSLMYFYVRDVAS